MCDGQPEVWNVVIPEALRICEWRLVVVCVSEISYASGDAVEELA